MNIYQNFGVNKPEDANLPVGTIGFPYTIIHATEVEKGYYDKDVLSLECGELGKKIWKNF